MFSEEQLQAARHIFKRGAVDSMRVLPVEILRKLCQETGVVEFRGKLEVVQRRLLEYVRPLPCRLQSLLAHSLKRVKQGWFSADGQCLLGLADVGSSGTLSDKEAHSLFVCGSKAGFGRMKKAILIRVLEVSTEMPTADYSRVPVDELRKVINKLVSHSP